MSAAHRLSPVTATLLAVTLIAGIGAGALPAAAQTVDSTTTTTAPVLLLPGQTTTTTAPSNTTTTAPATTTTTKPGVPNVPVGGPATTTTTVKPGTKPTPPPPQPDPTPILAQVDGDLAQLTAISDYQPAQGLVAKAQAKITQAGTALLSARRNLQTAQAARAEALALKTNADEKLRELAIAAYIGAGYSTPAFGDAGAGTANSPGGGLTGLDAVDAREMMIIVGQHVRESANNAGETFALATRATKAATKAYAAQQAAVGAAEAQLLTAQQTLRIITTAATTPGAAVATPIDQLMSAAAGTPAPGTNPGAGGSTSTSTTSTSTTTTTTTTVPGQPAVPVAIPATIDGAPPTSPTILGAPLLNQAELQAWWATLSRKPNLTVPINQLIASYATWGQKLGIRDDVAFAQSIVETGYFSFPANGQLGPKDNNFAGIGACDSCSHGWSFPSADTGVQAQMELLHLYASSTPWSKDIPNVIHGTSVGGCCQTWSQLAGTWASSTVYGISIMTVYQQMLQWLIPQQELAVGLIAPTSAAAKGPELAPLPGSSTTTTVPATNQKAATNPHNVSAAGRG